MGKTSTWIENTIALKIARGKVVTEASAVAYFLNDSWKDDVVSLEVFDDRSVMFKLSNGDFVLVEEKKT